jgi:PAB-dependent poly(A)-specific ribonuclease subunit 3
MYANISGFRLSNEKAIRPVKDWKRVDNGGVVSVIDAFTTRAFGDSSLIIVYNYHPLSKTLVEQHFTGTNRYGHRAASTLIAENVLWGYMVQIASAIKSVHTANLAVRCMDPSKVIVTDKHRIRLNACSVLDVVQFEANRVLAELQQEDFLLFGKLMLQLATNNLSANPAAKGTVEHLTRTYSTDFKDTILWLLTPAQPPNAKSIDEFISGISSHVISSYDSALHADDNNMALLSRELENGRIARLLCKLGNINERPEYDGDVKWSEVGERFTLKLFRDYVFHQVGADGKPVCDLGHMISCLNKLDAGTDEMIRLTSRDEEYIYYVTYKEIKKMVALSWNELVQKGQTPAKQMGGRY